MPGKYSRTLQWQAPTLDVHAGLRRLNSLTLTPAAGPGLGDDQLIQGLCLLSGLTHLSFRGCPNLLTDEGLE